VHAHVKALLRDPAAPPPRYLFLAIAHNNRGRHSYPKTTVTRRLQQLAELADIRDSQGRRPPLSHVHRFRHTRGTSLSTPASRCTSSSATSGTSPRR
jgi:hypothetical protein